MFSRFNTWLFQPETAADRLWYRGMTAGLILGVLVSTVWPKALYLFLCIVFGTPGAN